MTDKIIQYPDGVYFGMPEDVYHAQNRISSTGVKNLMISPATFWANSWLNPDKVEPSKKHFVLGHAYHTARLEPEEFNKRFVCGISKDDYAGTPTTHTAIKAELKGLNLPATKAGESAWMAAGRLKDAGYPARLYHLDLANMEASAKGREILTPADYKDVMTDMERLKKNDEVNQFLKGGAAEVSFLWTHEGIQYKVRFDYLSVKHYADFKTYANSNGKHLTQCYIDQFKYNRYYIQAWLYWVAAEIIRENKVDIYEFIDAETPPIVAALKKHDLITAIQKQEAPFEAWFIFQEKGGIPNLFARQVEFFRRDSQDPKPGLNLLMTKANVESNHAVEQYKQCLEIFEPGEPWGTLEPVGTINDADFGSYFLEG